MGFVPGKHRRKEIKNALNLRLFDNLWSGFELRFGFAYLLEGWLHGVELILGMVNMLLRSYLRLVAAGGAFIHKEWLHGVAFIPEDWLLGVAFILKGQLHEAAFIPEDW